MKENRHDRGSVLMEFIIVLPVYIVLFGGVFLIGDMAVHSMRLASADRTVAFDLQTGNETGLDAIKDKLFHITGEKTEITDAGEAQDDLSKEKESVWYADEVVDHPWSLRAAITMLDKYKLPVGGTAGRLLFATHSIDAAAPAVDGQDTSGDGFYMDLIGGKSVEMHSKDKGGTDNPRTYTYNYYTLKKTRYSADFWTWRDNRRFSSDLVAHPDEKHAWRSQVYKENYHEDVGDDETNRTNVEERNPDKTDYEYHRYGQFAEWSE